MRRVSLDELFQVPLKSGIMELPINCAEVSVMVKRDSIIDPNFAEYFNNFVMNKLKSIKCEVIEAGPVPVVRLTAGGRDIVEKVQDTFSKMPPKHQW